ncbi:DNA cytosine methyltransferase [Paenibacillus luteus]|uniref:DNA cytosine methyltransferase n=1 Tax=Paenibacillus luteus TaxID=2545753 RepID=UPI001F4F3C2E|nr:DNA (cytosine-5-)-methyltransferase [Paenibacillus luteus]
MYSMSVGSLFAGIGGFCTAFKREGFQIAWANEFDKSACETYRYNNPKVDLHEKSIEGLSVNMDKLNPVDVLTAGFPCQSFSVAGNQLGFEDPRGSLFFQIIRLIKEFGNEKPKIIVLENVKNLIYHDSGRSIRRLEEELRNAGYWFRVNKDLNGHLLNSTPNAKVLNTKDHTTIPQNRERLYMVALNSDYFKKNRFKFPDERTVPLADIQSFFDKSQKGEAELYFESGSKYETLFADAIKEAKKEGRHDSVYLLRRIYVRENKNNCAFTLTANMGSGGHNVPVIEDDWGIRKLTPRECLRLQGFKDHEFSFPIQMAKTKQYKQIGNAVTVDLVQLLAAQCKNQLIAEERTKVYDRLEFSI